MRATIILSLLCLVASCGQNTSQPTQSPTPTATSTPEPQSNSKVSYVSGKVVIKRGAETLEPKIGDKVFENDMINTDGDSTCELDLEGIGLVKIAKNTSFQIKTLVSDGKRVLVQSEVLKGSVRAKVHKLAKGEQFLVGTKSAIAGVRGTEFDLSLDKGDRTTVAVAEGSVAILPPSANLILLERASLFDQIADSSPHVTKGRQTTVLVDDLKDLKDQLDEIQKLIDQTKADQETLKKQVDDYEKSVKKSKIDTKPLNKDDQSALETKKGVDVLKTKFGKVIVGDGLEAIASTGEGRFVPATVDGLDYWQTDGKNTTGTDLASYGYFKVSNPQWRNGAAPKVRIELDYYDLVDAKASDSWVKLEYDSQNKPFDMHGFTGYIGKSSTWKTFVWEISDAKFNGGTNLNDFRIIVPPNLKLVIREVRVVRL